MSLLCLNRAAEALAVLAALAVLILAAIWVISLVIFSVIFLAAAEAAVAAVHIVVRRKVPIFVL